MTEQLTLLQADTPASRSARRGKGKVSLTPVTSGRLCLASLKQSDPVGLLAKMLLGTSAWDLTKCWPTWSVQRTAQSRLLFRLVPLAHPTGATESGLLLGTPTATERPRSAKFREGRIPKAIELAEMLPTPRNCSAMAATITAESAHAPNRFPNLETVIGQALFPTPNAMDSMTPRSESALRDALTKGGCRNLKDLVAHPQMFLPTPKANDYKGSVSEERAAERMTESSRGVDLPEALTRLTMETAGGGTTGGESPKKGSGVRLNPQFVEWMMGYPTDWTVVDNPPPKPRRRCTRKESKPLETA